MDIKERAIAEYMIEHSTYGASLEDVKSALDSYRLENSISDSLYERIWYCNEEWIKPLDVDELMQYVEIGGYSGDFKNYYLFKYDSKINDYRLITPNPRPLFTCLTLTPYSEYITVKDNIYIVDEGDFIMFPNYREKTKCPPKVNYLDWLVKQDEIEGGF